MDIVIILMMFGMTCVGMFVSFTNLANSLLLINNYNISNDMKREVMCMREVEFQLSRRRGALLRLGVW